jgi:hypothetical protein
MQHNFINTVDILNGGKDGKVYEPCITAAVDRATLSELNEKRKT